MNIILDKSLKTDSKQPKVFNLGQITTTLQDLLDNSTIVINGEQTIILSITDENDNILKYLLPLDYKGEGFYGFGKNILESDLISLGNISTTPYKSYVALLIQNGTTAPNLQIMENTLDGNTTIFRKFDGVFAVYNDEGIFLSNKTYVNIKEVFTIGDDTPISYNRLSANVVTDNAITLVNYNFFTDIREDDFKAYLEIRVYD